MRLLRTTIIFAAILALMPLLASAKFEDLEITGNGLEKAAAGSVVNIILAVDNKGSENLNVGVNRDPFATLESSWFEYIMFSPSTFKIEGGEKQVLNVSIKLKRTVPTDSNYKTPLTFYQLDAAKNTKDYDIVIRAVSPEEILKAEIEADSTIMPGKKYSARVKLKNNLNAVLPESEIFVSSELFEERRSIIMLPWQEREEEFSFQMPDSARPGGYTLNARVYYDKQLVKKAETGFTVSTISDVGGEEQVKKGFLWKRISVTRTSTGNTPTESSYQTRVTGFERLFARYSPEPSEFSGEMAKWRFSMNPGSEYTISVTVNYRPLLWAAIVIIAFTVFVVVVFKRGVTLKKEIMSHRTTHEGFTDIKVRIHIKNHDKTPLHDAVLMEVLPHHMHPKMEFGTLQPEAIEKGERGIRIRWNLEHVRGHEERIITYILSTKIGIIGDIELQPSLLRFKNKSGKIISVSSNKVRFSSGKSDIAPPKEHVRL
ncbi:MAG TPA: hypothetical protein HA362_03935 [Nanoarchaeota archaeon]|nr:hypothetical protein [Nanoarchaeota archaeon]